jgi:hypothetical protein
MIISLLGLYLFKIVGSCIVCDEHNTVVSIFIATVSVFLGIILTFIIITVWGNFSEAQLNTHKEAQTIFLLYGAVEILPNTEETQQLIIEYLQDIINVEFPAMKSGKPVSENTHLFQQLQMAIYGYNPNGDQQTTLYGESIDLLNEAISLRIDRLNSATAGIYNVIWWVTIIDSILLIIMSWFIRCTGLIHYIMVAIIAIYVATSLFLVFILSYPFEGYADITPEPFEEAFNTIIG